MQLQLSETAKFGVYNVLEGADEFLRTHSVVFQRTVEHIRFAVAVEFVGKYRVIGQSEDGNYYAFDKTFTSVDEAQTAMDAYRESVLKEKAYTEMLSKLEGYAAENDLNFDKLRSILTGEAPRENKQLPDEPKPEQTEKTTEQVEWETAVNSPDTETAPTKRPRKNA